jgi:hypothetical protein
MKERIENEYWIIDVETKYKDTIFGMKMEIHIKAKNKKTNEVINKTYKTTINGLTKTLSRIKKDFGWDK